ncbi:MAG: hypothetical protein LUE08_00530 [Akkermansiaceae bacterium]|nr:hypothetical protein [Akkermansiaceae bacterium]
MKSGLKNRLAQEAVDKGMPIEQLLGHKRMDTTLQYAMSAKSREPEDEIRKKLGAIGYEM